jgi:hypothetical protein
MATKELSTGRKLLLSCIVFAICLLIVEIGIRSVFAYRVGTSVFLYGTPFERAQQIDNKYRQHDDIRTVQKHENELEGYSKYFPNQVRYDIDSETQERFVVTINSQGFRGEDFRPEKTPGVTRIVTLGASSTFGYYSRDDDTYPMQLARILAHADPDTTYEVINLGIPHLQAANIYSLFITEGLPLDPDIVTFYEGNNDASLIYWRIANTVDAVSAGQSVMSFFSQYLVSMAFINSMLEDASDEAEFSVADIESASREISAAFLDGLGKIADVCAENDIRFIVANQQKQSTYFEREALRGMTYADEIDAVKAAVDAQEPVNQRVVAFIGHALMMQALGDWAAGRDIPLVDVISALDAERDSLVTHVHLNRRGNEVVATELSRAILAAAAIQQ